MSSKRRWSVFFVEKREGQWMQIQCGSKAAAIARAMALADQNFKVEVFDSDSRRWAVWVEGSKVL